MVTDEGNEGCLRHTSQLNLKNTHLIFRVLLMESSVNAEALNTKGQNPLHSLARYGKENAYAICNLIAETMPDFPLDRPDVDGNTGTLVKI